MAHKRQSKPHSGLGFQGKVLVSFSVIAHLNGFLACHPQLAQHPVGVGHRSVQELGHSPDLGVRNWVSGLRV